jgi:hypothetical protein
MGEATIGRVEMDGGSQGRGASCPCQKAATCQAPNGQLFLEVLTWK